MQRKKDQIYGQLKRAILDETLPPGSRLPTEKQLSKSFSVGQVTLRSALARLEAEGLVERVRSRGTFVTQAGKRRTFLLIQPDGTENLETPSRYIAAGLEEAAEKHSVTLEICPESLFISFSEEERAEIVRSRGISGIVLETGHRLVSEKVSAAVRALKLPVVIPHGLSRNAAEGVLVLRTDEKQAFKDAYRHLADCGHKKIASLFLHLPGELPDELRGFSLEELKEYLTSSGLKESCDMIERVNNSPEDIFQTVKNWFGLPEPPTAVLCHSDRIAMRVCAVLRQMELRIPEDVSIMGYSNYPGSQLLIPPLTTIDTCLKDCAFIALEKLLDSENWHIPGSVPQEIFTPYLLIKRASVVSVKDKKRKMRSL